MPEIRLNVDQEFLDKLKSNTGIDKASQLTNEAYTLLNWAASEARQGRILTTSNPDGSEVRKIVIPSLEKVKGK